MGSRSSLIDYRDTESQITVQIKRPSRRYLDEMFRLKCMADLLAWGVYPNAKEFTESAAAYEAVKREWGPESFGEDVVVLCVGDGSTPRTAALFACRTKWLSVSVDPQLSWSPLESKISRLLCLRHKVEALNTDECLSHVCGRELVVVAVHSHANLENVARFRPKLVVAIPCCVPQTYQGRPPDREYDDWGIHSPCRTVKIWRGTR